MRARAPRGRRGFTMVELLVVMVILGVAVATTVLSLRDGDDIRLAREAARLAALLEAGRAEARASGATVRWMPAPAGEPGFRFTGLREGLLPQTTWLHEGVQARIDDAGAQRAQLAPRAVLLGPEPLLPPQRVHLRLGDRELEVASDGFAPFRAGAPTAGE